MPYPRAPIIRSMRVVIRTSGDAAAAMSSIRKLVSDIDRTQPVYEFQTLAQSLSDSIAPRRFNLFLLLIFAATAMAMAVIGIYGVIAYSVAQRTHEIGIRIALGARRVEIVGMVVRHGMMMTFAGIVMGVIAAIALTRLMETLLYDVTPNDPPVYAAAAAILVVTALIACWGPAARAAAVDPVIALRQE
jgi:ABC-type antimicrobial peptide transport system permease subunit